MRRGAGAVVLLLALAWPAAPSAQRRGLTGASELARTYDAILDARFDEMPALLRQTCPPAPREACLTLEAAALWWRVQVDPHNRSLDTTFESRVAAAIAAADAWTMREPQRAEAWFYLGAAHGARAQFRVIRGQHLSAAQSGRRVKDALERALALDPALHDAYFGLGLYHYYAAVAPAAARLVRWLLLMPGGDRAGGIREMLRARSSGQLLAGEADYQLHLVYRWYEKQPARALELLRALRARHPRNPHFLEQIADIEAAALGNHAGSLRAWRELLAAARARRVALAAMAETRARLGIALQLYRLNQPADAVPQLRAVIATTPTTPYGATALAQLQLGYALDRLGRRRDAIAAYRAALAANPAGDPLQLARLARAGLRAPL